MILGTRAPYYVSVVWGFLIVQVLVTPFFLDQGFDYAVWIATPILTVTLMLTGGLGIAKAVQDWVDTRQFRKQLENVEVDH